ncbi:MAG: mannonate dehydratase [Planctomycetaceae bacterium]|nr:mannonate dehydratase [Planctomycetaceae bacterium]
MQLATVLTPISDENLALAAQCGVTELVARYFGSDAAELQRVQQWAERFGMNVSVVEGYLPIERLKLGTDDGSELAAMKLLLRQMSDAGVKLLCYNFMSGTDWVRTRVDAPERGGATVTEFRLADVERAVSLNTRATPSSAVVTQEQLWQNLDRFLTELLPAAEQCGVTLTMHPDDPPLPQLLGRARIMHCVENFERLVTEWASPSNQICFCQGSFASMGVDIPSAIRRLGPHIKYVHFRDVRGTPDAFAETFHDNGPTDMAAAMRAYAEVGFNGPMRPDHVPAFVGEQGEPGYTMLGRLFAYGYMRGLIDAVQATT